MIRRGTTPTVRITGGEDVDLTAYKWRISLQDIELHSVTVEDDRITKGEGYVECRLTQEETLSLTAPRAYVQVNGLDNDGEIRCASNILQTTVTDNLCSEVINNG